MKKFLFIMFLLCFPIACFGYTNLTEPPQDAQSLINWFFASMPPAGTGWAIIAGFVITLIIGIMKCTSLKSIFDKLGAWKFLLPMILGAIAEMMINLPSPFTWAGFLNIVATGALGNGAISIMFHHILDQFAKNK